MICRNCGFQNESRAEVCSSCGNFLDWTASGQGTPNDAEDAPTVVTNQPIRDPRAGRYDSLTTTTPKMARPQPQAAGRDPDVICSNCGQRNPGGRTFCLQCGEMLTAGVRTSRIADARMHRADSAGGTENWRRAAAIGAGILALLLIAAIGVATFLGGGAPGATPTPPIGAVASASPTAPDTPSSATPSPPVAVSPSPGPTVPVVPTGPLDSPMPTTATTPEPTGTAAPPATPRPPEIVLFRRENYTGDRRNVVDCTDPAFDGTIFLRWELHGATGARLSIDGPGLFASYDGKTGDASVPFSCGEQSHTYTLRTTGGNGPPDSVTRTIRQASIPTTPVPEPSTTPEVVALAGVSTNLPPRSQRRDRGRPLLWALEEVGNPCAS